MDRRRGDVEMTPDGDRLRRGSDISFLKTTLLPRARRRIELSRRALTRELNLTWASMAEDQPFVNFGDALGPIVVSAISGRRLRKQPFVSGETRLSSIGTIAQNFSGGTVRLWGSGLDAISPGLNVDEGGYHLPASTRFVVAACRGRHTRRILAENGVESPEVFGDPGWFANRIWPEHARQEKIHDIGVVLHLTEWAERRPGAALKPQLRRYEVPEDLAGRIAFINPITRRSVDGVGEVVGAIGRCRRILSTSLHGLVVAEALGIPAFYFGATTPLGPQEMRIADTRLMDHRMCDLYSILDRDTVPAFIWPRGRPLDWHQVLEWCDRQASIYDFDEAPLFEAFPFSRQVALGDERWPVREDFLVDGDFL